MQMLGAEASSLSGAETRVKSLIAALRAGWTDRVEQDLWSLVERILLKPYKFTCA